MGDWNEKHITYWWSAKYGNTRPKSRYIILFSLKGQYGVTGYSRSEYDDLAPCLDECDELNKMYATHPIPVILEKREIRSNRYSKKHLETIWDYSDGKSWWGYIVLDMKECKAIRVGGHGFHCQNHICYDTCKSINGSKETRDYFFRDPEVCPDEYKWKNGEYAGWLQFKWGDGTNAIGYVKPPKQKKKTQEELYEEFEAEDYLNELQKDYEAELIENKFADIIDKETQKRLMDRYGW